ncbi:hypothetical protein CANARDRAFT_26116 [[Candida] arabinofermentans NRRL YB-2248]|uniref:Adenylyl cyclase-associated protein n=1 Tax=[Candida] arabinofermentans NRRL YB-2248 TaxID=983967 RepID=A0A1E4T870_9ASCO|nr:hypothetical protein CANARDRAFT_26116 [[Candida] arabinofermentans NRRL YB-2248]
MSNESFSIHGYNLVTLLKRLEAATSRLEDVTIFQEGATAASSGAPAGSAIEGSTSKEIATPDADAIAATAAPTAAAPAPTTAPTAAIEEDPKSIVEFDRFIGEFIDPFVEVSKKLDPIVTEQAELFKKAILEERKFLLAASKSQAVELSDPAFQEAIQPINEIIMKIVEIKDKNRSSKFFNNLNTVAEGIPALGWICVSTPVSYIPDFKDSAQFWSNRILKEFKDTNPDQVSWAQNFSKIFDGLKVYAKEFHTTGPTFNPKGGSLVDALKGVSAPSAPVAPATTAGGPPPPPPPPPPPASVYEVKSAEEEEKPTGMNAIFSALNQGEAITSGLRKVDKSEMTHKNPALRAGSSVPAEPTQKKGSPVPPKKPSSLTNKPAKKAPKKELQDTKWVIANFENESEMITIEAEMHQSVFIANCSSCVIQIKGKANAISINDCKKIGIVIEKAISGVDVIKSSSFELQVMDNVPMISIDQSDSGSIYLSATSLSTAIFTSSTTALNINIPEGDDMKEMAVPEQFQHTVDPATGKLVSTIVEHAG